jgi:hypothetical protein
LIIYRKHLNYGETENVQCNAQGKAPASGNSVLRQKLMVNAIFIFRAYMYTGCPRRNVPNFETVFLILKYNDITQNTYIQS